MPELIQGIAAIVQQQAKAKQLDLDISISGLDHERVVGDTLRINQMLLNIVGNAVKFTPSGGQVNLKIRELPPKLQGYGCYRFIISDTGVGTVSYTHLPGQLLRRYGGRPGGFSQNGLSQNADWDSTEPCMALPV